LKFHNPSKSSLHVAVSTVLKALFSIHEIASSIYYGTHSTWTISKQANGFNI